VAEALGAPGPGPATLLGAVFSSSVTAGHPVVRHAALVTVGGAVLLVLGALTLVALRARTYGRLEASVLMVLGFVSMGSSEWVREGLRKPWVIDRYMFVNSVRLPLVVDGAEIEDPFTVDALASRGVLSTARFAVPPPGYRPGTPEFEALEPSARAALEAGAGAEVFRLECAACHTVDGHLGIRRLVRGRAVAALEATIDTLAQPVDEDGGSTSWSAPAAGIRVATRLHRRMPPFVGTAAEKRALAIHLARLGGDAEAGLAVAPADPGPAAFDTHCAACHGAAAPWPIAERLRWKTSGDYYDLLGRLEEVREEMPPFAGSEAERAALAEYLAALAASDRLEEVTS
jgi:mono/diheme cytochrome c family protein